MAATSLTFRSTLLPPLLKRFALFIGQNCIDLSALCFAQLLKVLRGGVTRLPQRIHGPAVFIANTAQLLALSFTQSQLGERSPSALPTSVASALTH